MPPDVGQTSLQVYIKKATGHTPRGTTLDFWRVNGADHVYGNPISELFAAENGRYSQAFEGAVFQYYPEYLYTDEPIMRLMPVGAAADAAPGAATATTRPGIRSPRTAAPLAALLPPAASTPSPPATP